METASSWEDFRILDAGDGEKIERWGDVILQRPDPQAIWPWLGSEEIRRKVQARYHRSGSGGGEWEMMARIPARWSIRYGELVFRVEPTGFKHTGLFPEQALNWDWMGAPIRAAGRPVSVLNLFAYTGGATVACAAAGASVCHVDASKGMVSWARENLLHSRLEGSSIRFIVDDCLKFVQREARRGRTYDAVIMDPPSYGRGPNGELWKLEDELYGLVRACMDVLTESPLFFLINSYTAGFSPQVPANLLHLLMRGGKGKISAGEVGLPIGETEMVLPCGTYARWESVG